MSLSFKNVGSKCAQLLRKTYDAGYAAVEKTIAAADSRIAKSFPREEQQGFANVLRMASGLAISIGSSVALLAVAGGATALGLTLGPAGVLAGLGAGIVSSVFCVGAMHSIEQSDVFRSVVYRITDGPAQQVVPQENQDTAPAKAALQSGAKKTFSAAADNDKAVVTLESKETGATIIISKGMGRTIVLPPSPKK